MANNDNPRGLSPVRYLSGAPYNGAVNAYFVPASDATALFLGDPVVKTGEANTSQQETWAPGTLPVVTRATAGDGNAITGVVVGVNAITHDSPVHRAASTDRVVFVCDDPDIVYRVQDDAASTLTASNIGSNANLVFTHAGDELNGTSRCELDASLISNSATNQLTIQRLAQIENNEIGDNAVWEVKINNHTEISGVAGQ